ncbi:hypothetical protein BCR32DRAFT_242635 [Anaeromyces robustus]|uniref:CBM21 domain-containing protein n=1 Tax=Anaeromyces robustus TaxID=1754192 RepID=A0A1Y1XG57_9FUNG|nr:hypothetical protein BCR32DRAFT_242635 [Anaeromyces robustus]|eukprot:ORX84396.1 hypothetical protein BCR32DRAFT_242635 [Anaeromyces robustus]
MSTVIYSHSYPPTNLSISPSESIAYPDSIKKQLLKTNGKLNINNNTNNKKKHKFYKNNYYKNFNKNNDKTRNSIFNNIKSSNFSVPIITPVTVHCTHEKDFSKPNFNSQSSPININSKYYHNHLKSSIIDTNLSPLKNNNKLFLNDKNYIYNNNSENPSMEDFIPSSEFNTIKSQETEDELVSLFPLNKSGETVKANSFDDISFQSMLNRTAIMEDNVNLINSNENNEMNNVSELTTVKEDISLINQLDHSKSNHNHNHYIENPFYYETTNMPAINSKIKPAYCCYCGNDSTVKLNNQLDNQNNNNNSDNILMKNTKYTPQSIPIPNVSTKYSSFDGIDNIEKTLEEVKELIEKSKALSLGEIISPSNHGTELNEKKIINNLENVVKQEPIVKKEEIVSENQAIAVIENKNNSKEESTNNDNNGNSFVKTTTLLTETITTTTTTTIKQLTKIEIEDNNIINEKQEVKEQTFIDKETKVEVINSNENEKSPKTEDNTEKKEDKKEIIKVYEDTKKEEDEEDESLYSSPDRANDSGFVSDDSTSCYSSRSSSPSGRRRRKSSLKSPNFPGRRKSVQFSNDLEMVCLFECLDAPEDIGESPQFVVPDSKEETKEEENKKKEEETKKEEIVYKNGICLMNVPVFTPFDMMSNVMGLESIELVDGTILKGTIQVKNLAYHKYVVIRYTLDNWNTSKEAPAVYTSAVTNGTAFYSDVGLDLFTFTIDMTSQFNAFSQSLVPHFADHPIVMSFAIRYEVNNNTYWDNNNTNNFQLEFIQLPTSEPSVTRKKCYRSPGYKTLLEMSKKSKEQNGKSDDGSYNNTSNNTIGNNNGYHFSSVAVSTIPAAKFAAMKKKRRQLASHPPVVVPIYPPPPSSDYISSNNTMFNASSYLIQQQQSAAYSSIYNTDSRNGRYGPSPYTIYK